MFRLCSTDWKPNVATKLVDTLSADMHRGCMGISRYSLVFILILSGIQIQAQIAPPTFRAIKTPSVKSLFPTQVAADNLGNTFWAGGYNGRLLTIGSLTATNGTADPKGFILKLGPSMEERWIKSGSGHGGQGITGLAVDASNGVYFAVNAWSNTMTFDNVTYKS